MPGVLNPPGPYIGTGPRPVRNRATQQEVSGGRASKQSFICRSPSLALPPEPSPHPPSVEKLSSTKLVPGAKKVGDHWSMLAMWFMVRASGHMVSDWPLEELEINDTHVGSHHIYMTPNKVSGHQGWGELPWLAITHTYCHTSLLGEASAVTGRGQQKLTPGTLLDSALWTFSHWWF